MTEQRLTLQLTAIEVAQLDALVRQFAELVDDGDGDDRGVARLVPDAYPDDADAGREFTRLTRDELLERRSAEAALVLRSLGDDIPALDALDDAAAAEVRSVELDREAAGAWMRTLAALRLVLAARLGIESEDDGAVDDPRYVLYEWLGAILDALVRALDEYL